MKLSTPLLALWLAAGAGVAAAAEKPATPATPDADYCARRDADPGKCVIQDGPRNPNYIYRKPPPKSKAEVGSRKAEVKPDR
jgi:hypothetical protein